jgi:hypothetical protein
LLPESYSNVHTTRSGNDDMMKDIVTQITKTPGIVIGIGLLIVFLAGSSIYLLIDNNNLKNEIFNLHETLDIASNDCSEHTTALHERVIALNNQITALNSQIAHISPPTITHRSLIFETNEDGYAVINSIMLGFENQPEKILQVYRYLPYNPIVKRTDSLYTFVEAVNDDIGQTINHFLTIDSHKRLILKPGYYYLGTNLGNFRILVLEKALPKLQKFFNMFYFYTSIAALGRSANYLTGDEALPVVFYSNSYSGNFCTGHVVLFMSVFKNYCDAMRQIDFYGFIQKGGEEVPEGHSVLEVYINGKWILVDPLLGFIPFDETGEHPLSFLEFLRARRKRTYRLKHLFHIPDLAFPLNGRYAYLAEIPNDGNPPAYLTKKRVESIWSITELLVYAIEGKGAFFMEKETYNNMTVADWSKYKNHYQGVINQYSSSELRNLINLNIDDLYR